MRTLRYVSGLVLFTVWYGGKVILGAVFGRRDRSFFDRGEQGWARSLLAWNGIVAEPVELERAAAAGPAVFISNHASFIDILALLDRVPGSVRFVAKKEFFRFPIIGLAMKAIGHVFIDRDNRTSAFSSYDEAARAIKGGISVVVFAEGTRSPSGKLLPFKKGPFVLAIAAGVPIVPVYCANTFALLPKGSWSPRQGAVEVRFGTPIPTIGMGYDARDSLAADARRQMLGLGATE